MIMMELELAQCLVAQVRTLSPAQVRMEYVIPVIALQKTGYPVMVFHTLAARILEFSQFGAPSCRRYDATLFLVPL
jgi:hypothetical protein